MHFPNSGTGRPFCRIDGRSGAFLLSSADGGDLETFEMKGKLLDLNLATASQGWLRLSAEGADWVPLALNDDWSGTPKPSPDHSAAVDINLHCPDWPEPRVRQLRGSSRCITNFIAGVAEAAGEVPDDRAVRIRITGSRVVKIGKGSSADIGFEVAPADKWPDATAFDAHRDAPEAAPPAPPAPAKSAWDELEDDGEF